MHFSASTFILIPYMLKFSALEYVSAERHLLGAI